MLTLKMTFWNKGVPLNRSSHDNLEVDLLRIAASSLYINEKSYLVKLCDILYTSTDFYDKNNSLLDKLHYNA